MSMLATFTSATAPSQRTKQYFEMMGNRAIYHDDWMASARSGLLPWVYAGSSDNMMQQPWELYDLSKDYSEANNLARQYPDKVKQMQSLFDEEAKKNQVYPLDPRMSGRGFHASAGRSTFYSGAGHLYNELAPPFETKSHTITAYVDIPKEGANGVLMADGAEGGGFALFLKDGRPTYTYNFFRKSTTIASPTTLPPGPAKIVLQLTYSGTGLNKTAVATLSVNDRQVATTEIARTELRTSSRLRRRSTWVRTAHRRWATMRAHSRSLEQSDESISTLHRRIRVSICHAQGGAKACVSPNLRVLTASE